MSALKVNKQLPQTSTRWGARFARTLTDVQTVVVDQFGDLKVIAPQQIAITLYALTTIPPPATCNVEWTIALGCGSVNHSEVFTQALTLVTAQVPLVLLRPASTVQVRARIIQTALGTTPVEIVALLAPSSPTWTTPLVC